MADITDAKKFYYQQVRLTCHFVRIHQKNKLAQDGKQAPMN
jgi:hypothetical protein